MDAMIRNSASPMPFPTGQERMKSLRRRRSAIDRLIRALEIYQRVNLSQIYPKKIDVA